MSAQFLRQYVLPSDEHSFVGRIYDLSIIEMHFDTYEELSRYDDCKYASDVNYSLSKLTRRVESLNMVGGMLWPQNMPDDFKKFPMSRYEWLTVCADIFLVRYISVVDCLLIFVNDIFECGLNPEECSITNLRKNQVKTPILDLMDEIKGDQGALRQERNRRFHHGAERGFSSNNQAFRIASTLEHRYGGGVDMKDWAQPVQTLFHEGLIELQKEFNGVMQKLVKQLDKFYDLLQPEFECRFAPKFSASPFSCREKTNT